jgi:hypothetical protein
MGTIRSTKPVMGWPLNSDSTQAVSIVRLATTPQPDSQRGSALTAKRARL